MKLSKGTYKFIFIAAFVVVVGGVALYFIFRDPPVEDPNKNGTPVPPGSPTPKWVPEAFPLTLGMYGNKIKALQAALGFTTAQQDGKLGPMTQSALAAKGKALPLSQTDYNNIVNPPATGGGTNFQTVKTALGSAGQNFSGGITGYFSGPNQVYSFDFYTNGRVIIYNSQKKEVARGTYSDGGKKIAIDGGKTYNANSVTLNMQQIATDLG